MKLGDYLVPTTVDWPGKCAMIVWFARCNFRCPFCQNGSIVPVDSGREVAVDTLKDVIRDSTMWTDGVVFSGGEPTLQKDALLELAAYTKDRRRGVLVDTNGSIPGVLEEMIEDHIVDRISLDIKAAPDRYQEVTGTRPALIANVLKSLEIGLSSEVELEVRTTVVPGLVGPRDIEAISPLISGCDVYYLQQFRPEGDLLDPSYSALKPPFPKDLAKLARIAKKHVATVGTKTRELGVQYH